MILCDIVYSKMQDDTQMLFSPHPVILSLVLHVGLHQRNLIMDRAGYCTEACFSAISMLSAVSITDL